MKNVDKRIKRAESMRNLAIADRDEALKERDSALALSVKAATRLHDIETQWEQMAEEYGTNKEGVIQKLEELWASYRELAEALAQKSHGLDHKEKLIEAREESVAVYERALQADIDTLAQSRKELDVAWEKLRAESEAAKLHWEKQAEEFDVKKLRKRLQAKSESNLQLKHDNTVARKTYESIKSGYETRGRTITSLQSKIERQEKALAEYQTPTAPEPTKTVINKVDLCESATQD